MKKLFTDEIICEILLTLYFSEKREFYLAENIIAQLDGFIDFYKTEDDFNNTCNADTIKRVYINRGFDTRSELLRSVHLSETSLHRFRCKILERLTKHLHLGSTLNENEMKNDKE